MTNIARGSGDSQPKHATISERFSLERTNPIVQVQDEISARPEFQKGSVLIIDESADKSGQHKAGSSRQHNGNLGKIEQSQVGVFAGLINNITTVGLMVNCICQKHGLAKSLPKHVKKLVYPNKLSSKPKFKSPQN
ncbi:MAG: hypothetical protein IPL28_15080 [Chloroflexi bacterium]|nr:hypothetical protein [Chloroflexota bacterium]